MPGENRLSHAIRMEGPRRSRPRQSSDSILIEGVAQTSSKRNLEQVALPKLRKAYSTQFEQLFTCRQSERAKLHKYLPDKLEKATRCFSSKPGHCRLIGNGLNATPREHLTLQQGVTGVSGKGRSNLMGALPGSHRSSYSRYFT